MRRSLYSVATLGACLAGIAAAQDIQVQYQGVAGSAFDGASISAVEGAGGAPGLKVTYQVDAAQVASMAWQNTLFENDCGTRVEISDVDLKNTASGDLTFDYQRFLCRPQTVETCKDLRCNTTQQMVATPLFETELTVGAAIDYTGDSSGVAAVFSGFNAGGEALPENVVSALKGAEDTGGWDIDVIDLRRDWASVKPIAKWSDPEIHIINGDLTVSYIATPTSGAQDTSALAAALEEALKTQGLYSDSAGGLKK